MKNKIVAVCLVLFASFWLCSCTQKQVLEGYVVDDYRKTPLPGRTVWVDDLQLVTDEKGSFKTGPLEKESVLIKIEGDRRFQEFTDQLVLYQSHNIRKFLMEARHPLEVPKQNALEPYSFALTLDTLGTQDIQPKVSMQIRGVPYDQTFEYKGSFTDATGHKVFQEMIQLDFNFWYRDIYQNWQFSTIPPENQPIWGMMMDPFIEVMYHYYHDLDYEYEVFEDTMVIEGEKVQKIEVTPVKPSKLLSSMTLWVIIEGKKTGLVKQAHIKTESHVWLSPEFTLVFHEMNVELDIYPPLVTH